MAKAILTAKVDPTYDDLPEERYHFPHTYLRQMEQAVGDWIIYYEPRRPSGDLSSSGGRQAYFAAARLVRIGKDPVRKDHYYAFIEDYLEFDRLVFQSSPARCVSGRAGSVPPPSRFTRHR